MHPEDTGTLNERRKRPMSVYMLLSVGILLAVGGTVVGVHGVVVRREMKGYVERLDTCCAACQEPFEEPDFEYHVNQWLMWSHHRIRRLEEAFGTKYPQMPLRLIAETTKLHEEFKALARLVVRLHDCWWPNQKCEGAISHDRHRGRFPLLLGENDLPPRYDDDYDPNWD